MNLNRSHIVAFTLAGAVGACQLVSGLDSFEEGSAAGGETDASAEASTDAAVDRATPPADAGLDAVVPGSVGGAVHFLQSGPLELSTNGRTVTVSASGTFTFPGTFAATDTYDVTVSAQPAGQRCWVAKGSGTVGTAVTDIDVRCAVIASSVGAGTDQKTLSSAWVDMADLAPIAFTTDVASQAFVSLTVPTVQTWTDAFAEYRFAIEVDGTIVAESAYRSEKYSGASQVPAFVSMTFPLPAGAHTLKGRWRLVDVQLLNGGASDALTRLAVVPAGGTPLAPELDVVVLDSVRAFDRFEGASSTTPFVIQPPSWHSDHPVGGTLNLAAPGKSSLVVARIPMTGADAYAKLSVDGNVAAFQRRLRNDSWNNSTVLAPVIMLDGGSAQNQVTANVGLVQTSATEFGMGICYGVVCARDAGVIDAGPVPATQTAALGALVWKGDAPAAYASSATPSTVGGAGQTAYVSVATTPITLARPSKVLVFASVSGTTIDVANQWIEIGVFAGATRTATVLHGHGEYADSIRSNPSTAMGIVELPAGTTTLDLRVRNTQGAGAVTLGTPYQENGLESFYGFGAVALE